MRIEFAAPRDLIGYQRYEGYLAGLYSPDWPYGRLPNRVLGLGRGEKGAEARAELALSLAAHGRRIEAAHYLRESEAVGESDSTLRALETLTFLVAAQGGPALPVEMPMPGPQLSERDRRALLEGFESVRRAVDEGELETALSAMEEIAGPLRREGGPSLALLHAYLLYKTGDEHPSRRYQEASAILEELIREQPAYVARHPEVYYFLGRSYDLDLRFDLGVRNMRRYVELRHQAMTLVEPPIAPPTGADKASL
ncbi:MAG: hypothetical protein H5U40_18440 [Polyangiaceae bacterium]|nr:hypothetical protein [Polyangiaceae bacterium]